MIESTMKSYFFAIHVNKHALRHCGLDPQSHNNKWIAGQARNDDAVFYATKIFFEVNSIKNHQSKIKNCYEPNHP